MKHFILNPPTKEKILQENLPKPRKLPRVLFLERCKNLDKIF